MLTLNIQNATITLPPGQSIEAVGVGTRMVMTVGEVASAPAVAAAAQACASRCGAIARPSAPTPAPGAYWPGQGGFYAGTWPAQQGLPARHLVFAEEEASELAWGGYSAKSRLDGRANTAALLADSTEHPAAVWASKRSADGHSDFHLPAQADLFMAMLTCPERFEKSGWCWSSTQDDSRNAFCQGFAYGNSYWNYKDNKLRVRAVRWVQL